MRPRTTSSVLATLAAALLLGACGSGGIGDIINGPGGNYQSQLKGIVRTVDTRSGDCRIELDNVNNSNYLNQRDPYGGGYGNGTGSGNRATLYCDSQTRVVYQGNAYRPDSLESGDEIIADVRDVNGRLVADRIDVTYDVSSNDRYGNDRYGNNPYPNDPNARTPYPQDDRYGTYGTVGNEDVRGTVQRVDRENRTVTLERVQYYDRNLSRSGDLLTLYYDNDTRVTFRNQSYRAENLEAGDIVAVDVDQVRGTLVADDIRVLADARGSSASYPR